MLLVLKLLGKRTRQETLSTHKVQSLVTQYTSRGVAVGNSVYVQGAASVSNSAKSVTEKFDEIGLTNKAG